MEKNIKKIIKIKWGSIGLLICTFLFICFGYYIFTSIRISNIYIKGNTYLSDQEIIEMSSLSDYPSFLKTSSKKIKEDLKKSPYIISASVKKELFGTIKINIEEASPLFIDTDSKLVLSSSDITENEKKIVAPSLINYVPDNKYLELIKQHSRISESIRNEISEIQYIPTNQDKDRFLLYMNDGNQVYLTLTKWNRLSYYNQILKDFPCQRGIFNLDSGNYFEVKLNICN